MIKSLQVFQTHRTYTKDGLRDITHNDCNFASVVSFHILVFIPEGVAVTAGMAGVTATVFPIPLTITLLLGFLGGQPDLLPVIAIGAVTGFVISKALTLLPKELHPASC